MLKEPRSDNQKSNNGGEKPKSLVSGVSRLRSKCEHIWDVLGKKQYVKGYFVLPSILFSFIMGLLPLVFMLYLAFNSWQPGSGGIKWVGLRNFYNLFHDQRFFDSLIHTGIIVVAAIAIELILGILVALLLQLRTWGNDFFRTIIVLPVLLTPIALAYSWRMMFDYQHGPINYFLSFLGIAPVQWLGNGTMGLISIILVDVWQWTPFVALFLLAALESQDLELYDAAMVDGANLFEIYRWITIPLLFPFLFAVAMLRSIDTIKLFDTVYVLTGGGPGNATETITAYNYAANFRTFNMGYMSAVSIILLIIVTIIFSYFMKGLEKIESDSSSDHVEEVKS